MPSTSGIDVMCRKLPHGQRSTVSLAARTRARDARGTQPTQAAWPFWQCRTRYRKAAGV